MELTTQLLLPLVGGYAFSVTWAESNYLAARETGHRLYFRSAFYAIFLLICSCFIHILLFLNIDWYQQHSPALSQSLNVIDFKSLLSNISLTSVMPISLVLGITLGHLLNFPLLFASPQYTNLQYKIYLNRLKSISVIGWFIQALILVLRVLDYFGTWYAVKLMKRVTRNNDFEELLVRAMSKTLPVMFTLESGKCFVGWIIAGINPVELRKEVRLLPMLSGYRDQATHKENFTVNYHNVLTTVENADVNDLNHLEPSDFEIVIPYDRITSSHLFDPEAYIHFQSEESQIEKDHNNEVMISSDAEDPISCPQKNEVLWSQHPKKYLSLKKNGKAKCDYCSTEFISSDSEKPLQ